MQIFLPVCDNGEDKDLTDSNSYVSTTGNDTILIKNVAPIDLPHDPTTIKPVPPEEPRLP